MPTYRPFTLQDYNDWLRYHQVQIHRSPQVCMECISRRNEVLNRDRTINYLRTVVGKKLGIKSGVFNQALKERGGRESDMEREIKKLRIENQNLSKRLKDAQALLRTAQSEKKGATSL